MTTISSPFTFPLKFFLPVWCVGGSIRLIGFDEETDMEWVVFVILRGPVNTCVNRV